MSQQIIALHVVIHKENEKYVFLLDKKHQMMYMLK